MTLPPVPVLAEQPPFDLTALSREAARIDTLDKAGVTELIVPLVKKAVKRLDEELDAQKVQHFAYQGEVVDERTLVDHQARQGAIQKTFELADVLRPRTDSTAGARPVNVHIVFPDWASAPPAIDCKAVEVLRP